MNANAHTLLERFEQLQIEAPSFRHIDHIRVAYVMLDAYEFIEACARYAATIRTMAAGVGALEKYNATITLAFMSLIAERKSEFTGNDFDAFLDAHPDLLAPGLLADWYTEERLTSPEARRAFLLPDKIVRSA